MKFKSIRQKVILSQSSITVALLVLIAVGSYLFFSGTTKQIIFNQQYSLVSRIAGGIDNRIESSHQALINVAARFPLESLENKADVQKWLLDRAGIATLFSYSIFILDNSGKLIAINTVNDNFKDSSFAYREYFKKTIATGKPFISDPFLAADRKAPVVVMTAPMFNSKGDTIGILVGTIALSFFDNMLDSKIGTSGYLYMFAQDRTMILHPDKKRIMQKDVLPGMNIMFDKALAGFEGSGETINSRGIAYLVSFKRLKSTNWILAANCPIGEAYQPIHQFEIFYSLAMIVILFLIIILSRKLGSHITKPLIDLTAQIKSMQKNYSIVNPLNYPKNDEIGLLAEAFNELIREINSRQQQVEAATLQLRLLSTAIDQSTVTTVITDLDGNIIFVNPQFTTLTGYSAAEAIGKNPKILKSGYTTPAEYAQLWATITTGQTWHGVFQDKKKNGELYWESATISPVKNESGVITNYLAVKEDITKRKLAEEELQETMAQLEKATTFANDMAAEAEMSNKAKSDFLANMSHEIRTPMNGIIGMANLLLETDLDDQQRDFAETVVNSGETLLTIINDILDLSKIEAGKMELESINFDLDNLLHSFALSLALRTEEKGLEFICAAAPDVPTKLVGDPLRLRQILTNLVGNALKFTERGEISVIASLKSASETDAVICFTVKDSGIGIPANKLGILFDKFSQVDSSTTRQYGGTGLGLAISKELSEIMGGKIGVKSTVNTGSEFWFTVSVQKQPETDKFDCDMEIFKNISVMIVDDNHTNRQMLSAQLTTLGCQTIANSNGITALQDLYAAKKQNQPIQLIIIDLQMPDMDGLTLAKSIRADLSFNESKIIMMTPLKTHFDQEELSQIGLNAYLHKPVAPKELVQTLSAVLSNKMIEKQPEQSAFTERRQFKARVLLAEDNRINQKVALTILNKLGLKANIAEDGYAVLTALKERQYDLILMDVQMPSLDGLETTRQIRSGKSAVKNPRIPIIAMTANAMHEDKATCLAAGMNDYMVKPVDVKQLIELLEKWLPSTAESVLDSDLPVIINAPENATTPELPIFDRAGVLRRLMNSEDILKIAVESFLEGIPEQMAKLTEALENSDAKAITLCLHTIRGLSATVGAERMHQLVVEMEKLGKKNEFNKVLKMLPQLVLKLEEATKVIEEYH